MSYLSKIKILENQLKQLENGTDKKDLQQMAQIIDDLRSLRRLEWEENHERVNIDDER